MELAKSHLMYYELDRWHQICNTRNTTTSVISLLATLILSVIKRLVYFPFLKEVEEKQWVYMLCVCFHNLNF